MALKIPHDEAEELRHHLRRDYNERLGIGNTGLFLPGALTEQAIRHLSRCAVTQFYAGNYDDTCTNYELVLQFMGADKSEVLKDVATAEGIGISLYMAGRSLSNSELPSLVAHKIKPIFQKLMHMSKQSGSALLYGLAHSLLANAYYGAGGYSSSSSTTLRLHKCAMHHAALAISALPQDHHERLFAYRTMAASANCIGDSQTVLHVLRQFKRELATQPEQNYINSTHLGVTLCKGLANLATSDPFWIRDLVAAHFRQAVDTTGAYEVSSIKEELETLTLLKCQDIDHLRAKAELGQALAEEYALKRHSLYFKQLLRSM